MLHFLFPNLFEALNNRVDDALTEQKSKEYFGLISDYEKLIILKQQLYRAARNNEDTAELCRAIDCLQEGLDSEMREKNSFNSQLSGIINSLILAAVVATGLSYAVTKNCGNFNSQLCRDARVIPSAIARYIK